MRGPRPWPIWPMRKSVTASAHTAEVDDERLKMSLIIKEIRMLNTPLFFNICLTLLKIATKVSVLVLRTSKIQTADCHLVHLLKRRPTCNQTTCKYRVINTLA